MEESEGQRLVGRQNLSFATTSSLAKPLTIRAGAWILAGSMLRLVAALLPTLALRQQLATLATRRRHVIRPADRTFWILLRRIWSGWARSLAIVQPDTVIRWHRAGFRIY